MDPLPRQGRAVAGIGSGVEVQDRPQALVDLVHQRRRERAELGDDARLVDRANLAADDDAVLGRAARPRRNGDEDRTRALPHGVGEGADDRRAAAAVRRVALNHDAGPGLPQFAAADRVELDPDQVAARKRHSPSFSVPANSSASAASSSPCARIAASISASRRIRRATSFAAATMKAVRFGDAAPSMIAKSSSEMSIEMRGILKVYTNRMPKVYVSSGRLRAAARARDCSRRHSAIFAWSPLRSTAGTSTPRKVGGRV